MRKLAILASIAALVAAFAGANAQSPTGFRLLKLDGRSVIWSKWVGEPAVTRVTYAFVAENTESKGAMNCEAIGPVDGMLERSRIAPKDFRSEVRAAFDMWEQAANITFTEVDDPARAGILIGAQLRPHGRAFANVTYKGDGETTVRSIERSLICFNPMQRWKIGFDGNLGVYDIRYTVAHEIGHAIGLDHPGATGQLMHYRYEERFRDLQTGDIEGAIVLYGPRPSATPGAPRDKLVVRAAVSDPSIPVTPEPSPR